MEMAEVTVSEVRHYWDSHPLGIQYVTDDSIEIGSPEFFAHIRPWMNPYKFPWIMLRIEREAEVLQGKHLLEVGCGLGFDSLEFLRRGVRVTATDLTPTAVELARRHFEIEVVAPEEVRMENALELSFPDDTFDAVWANGVLHATGDTARAISEVRRVLKPRGRAIISHFYRRPSWMYVLHRFEIEEMFLGFEIIDAMREHYRALPICRSGVKAALYTYVFKPIYNLQPVGLAERFAYKYSVTAVKQ
jgi:ubiquinone/menaquinone biosynthesis C-methylase UbiE